MLVPLRVFGIKGCSKSLLASSHNFCCGHGYTLPFWDHQTGSEAWRQECIHDSWQKIEPVWRPRLVASLGGFVLVGLLDLPNLWWIAIQRVLFQGSPQASWHVKPCETNSTVTAPTTSTTWIVYSKNTQRLYQSWMPNMLHTEVCVSNDRALVILENFRLHGISAYLAKVAIKHMRK